MSVLEFIAAWKWPVVVLVALAVVSRGFKRNPDMGAWFRRWLDSRDVRGKIGPTEFEATASQAASALQAAAASDTELSEVAVAATASTDEAPQDMDRAVTEMRREAVEDLMRSAARWGFDLAKAGLSVLPEPDVSWASDGRPSISVAARHWPDPLPPTVLRLLEILDRSPDVSYRQLGEQLGMSAGRAHRIVLDLKQRGHIVDTEDGRRVVMAPGLRRGIDSGR